MFLAWSGSRSQKVATVLRQWLPVVLPYVKPWMSEEDIAKGTPWSPELWKNLRTANFGVLCLVAGMASNPWVLFEAGALAGGRAKDRVAPLLVGIDVDSLPRALSEFQCVRQRKQDVLRLLRRIQQVSPGVSTTDGDLTKAFERSWPAVSRRLRDIQRLVPSTEDPPRAPAAPSGAATSESTELDSLSKKILLRLATMVFASESAFGISLQIPKPIRLIKLKLSDMIPLGLVHATSDALDLAYFSITPAGTRLLHQLGLLS